MKTNPTSLTCRVVRAWAALRTDGEAAFVARHTARCAACRQHFAATAQLTASLHRDARMLPTPPPPVDLDRRILAALDRSAPEPKPERHAGRYLLTLAGAAAAVALAFLGPWSNHKVVTSPAPVPIARHDAPPAISGDRLAAILDALPAWKTSVTTALEKEPLREEVDFVYSDARSAVHFLAMNFLPAESPSSPTRRAQSGG